MPGFARVSPDVGVLDEDALGRAVDDDPDAALELLATLTAATDPALREAARRLASRLYWRLAEPAATRADRVGRMTSQRNRPHDGDVDLDRSAEALLDARATRSAVDVEQLWTHQWGGPAVAWCLVLDSSGSMHGRALATAALTSAAFLLRAGPQRAVVSFADEVLVLASMADGRPDDDVLDRVLSVRGSGTTDLAGALRTAADQLGRSRAPRRVTLLLSDCRATVPDDVVPAARLHDELLVLAPTDDPTAARDLVTATGGRLATLTGPSDVPAAVARLLG